MPLPIESHRPRAGGDRAVQGRSKHVKPLVVAAFVGILGFVAYWSTMAAGDSEKIFPIQIAYGNAGEGQLEMHTNVGVAMVAMDRGDEFGKIKNLDEWVTDHFKLTDAAGQPVRMDRQNNSKLIKPHQVIGTEEFFLVSKLKQGEQYTYEYKPRAKEAKTYQYKFKASNHADKPLTYNFDLVRR